MTQYCPNCNHEFGPEDQHCANCGSSRPPVIQKKPTLILSQNMPETGAEGTLSPEQPVASETAAPPVPAAASGAAPAPSFSWALPSESDLAGPGGSNGAALKDDDDDDRTEPSLPTFWKCLQCISLNPASSDYCETCGALKPSATPEKREAAASDKTGNIVSSPVAAPPGSGTVPPSPASPDPITAQLPSDIIAALAASQPVKPGIQLISSSLTDVGLSRKGGTNEDSYFSFELKRCFESNPESFGFYMVADGMGGQAAGEVASRTAIETVGPRIMAELAGPWLSGQNLEIPQIKKVLQDVIGAAHTRLYEINHREQLDSGTTVTACVAVGRSAVFANVGDSRTYLFSKAKPIKPATAQKTAPLASEQDTDPGNRTTRKLDQQTDKLNSDALKQAEQPKLLIERVTRDQSLVQHLVDQGELTPDQVYDDPRRNVILFALGAPDKNVPVDTTDHVLESGDIILLSSDGLWEMVRDPAIAEVLLARPDLGQAAQALVELANENGGADNITVILVRVI
ncbi:MAG: hypothetical protein JWP00_2440 [Chloroflexi bacterium]|nr:hypothetical protein [Chloroflexota bacterium]